MTEIKVLPPTIASLKKIGCRILENRKGLKKTEIKEAVELALANSVQDVPSFLNTLQFSIIPVLPALKKQSKKEQTLGLRDCKIETLHIAGKFLYNKRPPDYQLPAALLNFNVPNRPNLSSYQNQFSSSFHYTKMPIQYFNSSPVELSSDETLHLGGNQSQSAELRSMLVRQPKWIESETAEQLHCSQMLPKMKRPPFYCDVDVLLDDLASELPQFVDLLYANFPYFYGDVEDAAELLDQLSYSDALLRWRCMGMGQSSSSADDHSLSNNWEAVACKSVLDSNLHPRFPTEHFSDDEPENLSDCENFPDYEDPFDHQNLDDGSDFEWNADEQWKESAADEQTRKIRKPTINEEREERDYKVTTRTTTRAKTATTTGVESGTAIHKTSGIEQNRAKVKTGGWTKQKGTKSGLFKFKKTTRTTVAPLQAEARLVIRNERFNSNHDFLFRSHISSSLSITSICVSEILPFMHLMLRSSKGLYPPIISSYSEKLIFLVHRMNQHFPCLLEPGGWMDRSQVNSSQATQINYSQLRSNHRYQFEQSHQSQFQQSHQSQFQQSHQSQFQQSQQSQFQQSHQSQFQQSQQSQFQQSQFQQSHQSQSHQSQFQEFHEFQSQHSHESEFRQFPPLPWTDEYDDDEIEDC